jgi:endonuclease YncB( thermonuclease family)
MRALLSMLVLTILATPIFAAEAGARTLRATVVTALDGDSIRVKLGARKRTYNLAGVDAPGRRDCYGAQARARLNRLVRGKAVRLRVVRGRNVEVLRGRRNVNRALVASGHARAKSGGGRRGAALRKDEARARARSRGLHRACAPVEAAPPTGEGSPVTPGAGDLTGAAAVAELTANLQGMAFSRSTSSGDSTTNHQLHLCAGGAFRYWTQESYSSGGTSFNVRSESLGQGWTVSEAVVKADGSRAAIVRGTVVSQASNSGPQPVSDPAAAVRVDYAGDQWHVDGQPVLTTPGGASCAPLLSHG